MEGIKDIYKELGKTLSIVVPNKEESLLPNVNDLLKNNFLKAKVAIENVDKKALEICESTMKEYGELVRKVTLEFAAKKAKVTSDESDWGRISYDVDDSSILSLDKSPELKIH